MHDELRSVAGLALLFAGIGAFGLYENFGPYHMPHPELTYRHTPKPLSKRARQRQRGSRKP